MTAMPFLSLDACRTDPAFPGIKDIVVARTGMAFYRDRDDALARAVSARIAALALPGCAAYRQRLLDSGQSTEWDTLIDEVTIGETYFFRFPEQFDALRDVVIPDLVERRRQSRRLRIWSAGCASGPEPYSIAILLRLDLAHLVAGWSISILGTDISRGKLARAAAGEFSDWELRQMPERYRTCFERTGAGWRIHDAFKRHVSFKAQNLLDPGDGAMHGAFDLILCRNVMIYFDADTNRELTRTLHRGLDDGGWLVVGHAEPHLEITNLFHPWPLAGTTLYRKWADRPVVPVVPPSPPSPSSRSPEWPSSPPAPRSRVEPPPWMPPVFPDPIVIPSSRDGPAAGGVPTPAGGRGRSESQARSPDAVATALAEARRLANGGDWALATALCQQLIDLEPLDADAHYLLALILGHQGVEAAAHSLRRALYIDRSFALAHYQLGRAAGDAGDLATAGRSLRNALSVLDAVADTDPVRGGEGLTAGELRELTRLQLRQLGGRG